MRSDYRSQKSGFFVVATPPQQWHRFLCVSIYKGKYADSLCQIRHHILKFSPRNLMICLKRDQITCFEGMLFHSKMTYIRMTRQYSKKKEEGAVTAITLTIPGQWKTERLRTLCPYKENGRPLKPISISLCNYLWQFFWVSTVGPF